MDQNRQALLQKIMALDFAVVDLVLFLDTHPGDRRALNDYNTVVQQSKMLRETYERMYGPLVSYRSPSCYPWQWICNPWPWEYDFNRKEDAYVGL